MKLALSRGVDRNLEGTDKYQSNRVLAEKGYPRYQEPGDQLVYSRHFFYKASDLKEEETMELVND